VCVCTDYTSLIAALFSFVVVGSQHCKRYVGYLYVCLVHCQPV